MTVVTGLRVDSRTEPLAVAASAPAFSWRLESDERDVSQLSFRIVVRRVGAGGEEAVVWDSGTVASAETIGVRMPPGLLRSGTAYRWSVEAVASDSVGPAVGESAFETAPNAALWDAAEWITMRRHDYQNDDFRPAPYLRKRVDVRPGLVRARLHATAGGIYEAWISGRRVGASSYGPGWTDYDKRVAFHSYDVTDRFAGVSTAVVGAIVADGWYAGGVGPFHRRNFWGKHPVWRALLVLDYADGSTDVVATDATWEGAFGEIHAADLLQGEVIDARDGLGDWSGGETLRPWRPVKIETGPTGVLVPAKIDPPRPVAELPARSVAEPLPGTFVYDLGQNFAGRVRLRLDGAPGTIVRVRHGEALYDDGALYVENLRGARATDTYILDGTPRVFEPTFTLHGFRYVEVTGVPHALPLDAVTGVAISSATRTTADLETDSPLIDQLVRNIRWSLRSNFMDVPTDCPSRDERAGWTGDAQIFATTATYFADVEGFFSKWMDDVLDAALPSGALPDIAPGKNLLGKLTYTVDGSSGYAEAGLVVPWTLYERYGNTAVLETAYEAGARWVQYVKDRTFDLVWRANRNTDYGDWLAPVETPKDLTATAYFDLSIWIMARAAEVLGRDEDARRFRALFEEAAAAFRRAFVDADGTMPAATQAAYTLALSFDLLTPAQRPVAAAALAADIEARGNLTTGFLSVSRLLPLLSAIGRSDLAYRLILNEEYPSWGHPSRCGATTIWERWDGWRPETGFQDPLMNSFNHFALGSVGEWIFSAVGGIAPAAPGYRAVRVSPQLGFAVNRSRARFESVAGPIEVEWSRDGASVELAVSVPANTSAEVSLPARELTEAGVPLAAVSGVRSLEESDRGTAFTIGSGAYTFQGRLEERQG